MQVANLREAADFSVQALAGDLARPAGNPFFERWALQTTIEHLAAPSEHIQTIAAGDPENPGAVLPLTLWLNSPPGIGPVWSVWDHIHCFDTTPTASNDATALLDAVFGFLSGRRASMLRWSGLPTDTPFYEGLIGYLSRHGLEFQVTKTLVRPVLAADDPQGSELVATYLGSKRLREFRRCRRRLEEMGSLELNVHDGAHDAGSWIGDFLDIEASGWKGAQGTAMACKQNEQVFFTQLARRMAEHGRALVYSLDLAGRPIAMTVNFRADGRIWCFKTAYRDELAKFSPGALIEYEATLAALDDPSVNWLDACTTHEGGLMGELWRDRREIVDLLISAKPSNNRIVRTTSMLWKAYLAAKRNALDTVGIFSKGRLAARTQGAV